MVGEPRKTALALSAGGMFGAYQAGVWEALADVFRPGIVVGASVGSLNGWNIAGGCEAAGLAERWRNLHSLEQVRWRFPRRWSEGFIDSSVLEEWIRGMCSDCTPLGEFGAVLTEMPSLRPRLFRWPELSWEHIAASCGVPGFLKQYRIGGTMFADGGILDPSPAWAAIEMGADLVVSVNVLGRRPPAVRALVRAASGYCRVRTGYSPPQMKGCSILDIDPIERLGSARDSMYWSRGNAERWIAAGRRDALLRKQILVECLEQDGAWHSRQSARGPD